MDWCSPSAIDGTVEVIPSVISSVLTTVITFLPLCFVSGVMGKFIAVMPFALIATLLMSLAEATLVLPGHLAHEKNLVFTIFGILLYPLRPLLSVIGWAQGRCDRGLKWFVKNVYPPTLDRCLDNRLAVLATAVGILLIALGVVRSGITPFQLFPKIDASRLLAKIVYPDGTPASVTEAATKRIELAAVETAEKFSTPAVPVMELVHRTVGQVTAQGQVGPDARMSGSHVGAVALELVEGKKRSVTSEQFISEWRRTAGEFPGAETLLYGTENIGPGGKPVEFKLLSASGPAGTRQLEAAMEFKSYFQPLLIIAAIPFGIAGAVFGHAVMGMSLTLLSMFGLVALAGVVVNDSIVLVDFINARVRAGNPVRQALREAGCVRFRPVMLTSITTIGGLMPLLFE
ncbi:MAG: efflux RND transporter permease subunit, partial [Planctomycetota bacterium]